MAAILSRVRSAMISRSNWAKDSKTLRTSRPMEVAVLNCCVTDTKATLVLLEGLHEACEVEQGAAEAIDLVDDHAVDLAGLDVGHAGVAGRAVPCCRR